MEGLKAYFSSIDSRLFNHVSGKPKEFINAFREQNFLSEEAFAVKLCGENYNKSTYREWKSRTLKILQALVIISNKKSGSLVKKKFDECQKKFLIGQKFLTQGQRTEGIKLIKQAYRLATEYDFVHLACELSSILYHDYVYYNRNKQEARFYAKEIKQYLVDYAAEKEAEDQFYQIIEQMYETISVDYLYEAKNKVEQINGNSIKCKVYQASIGVLYGIYSGQHNEIITSCHNALCFFRNKLGVYPAHYIFFLKNKGMAEIAVGNYSIARNSLVEAEQYITNSPYNFHMVQFYKTLNELHAGNYQAAYDLFQANKRCKIKDIKKHFIIIEAYLCFLVHTGYLQIDKIFRIGKYLNETLKAQGDKRGDNINILIAELLIYLARDKGKFIDCIESIQHYSYRHLRGKDTERAYWFIKILCLMAHPKVNFHPVALQRKAKKYIDLLNNGLPRIGENFAVEIIPFDSLLNMILRKVINKAA